MKNFKNLTNLQNKIIPYVVAGFTNPQIAFILNYSVSTVKSEMSEIFKELNVTSRVQLAVKVDRSGLFPRLSDEEITSLYKKLKESILV